MLELVRQLALTIESPVWDSGAQSRRRGPPAGKASANRL
jgi:hypothetical protein